VNLIQLNLLMIRNDDHKNNTCLIIDFSVTTIYFNRPFPSSCLCAAWYLGILAHKTRLESEPVTTDLKTTVVKPTHSLNPYASIRVTSGKKMFMYF